MRNSTSRLIVILPPARLGSAPEFDFLLSTDGHAVQGRGTAAQLPSLSRAEHEFVALVPASALAWHRVHLPGAIGKLLPARGTDPIRLRAVLAGLMEEQLLDEPELLRFAVFPGSRPELPAWVAVCERAWLHDALQALEQAGRRVSRIVPELAPPVDDSRPPVAHISAAGETAKVLLSTPTGACELPWCSAAVTMVNRLEDVEITADPEVLALAEQTFQRAVRPLTAGERHLQAAASAWNLAQFELAPSRRTRWMKAFTRVGQELALTPRWRAVRWGLGLLLLTQLVGLSAWAWKENEVLARKRAMLTEILRQTFPEVILVVDARLQMQRGIDDLQHASAVTSGPALDTVLAAVGQAAPDFGPLHAIESMRGELRLKGAELEAAQAAALPQQLAAIGLAANYGNGWLVIQPGERP